MSGYRLIYGDCLEKMRDLPENSIDAIVTDPPYGLSFMGNDWDHGVPGSHFWQEALRVAKPGCHLLAFGGTRTFHRLTCAIEDAGWEIRDCLMWVYGSGFPKSLDVSKAIDKAAGVKREIVGIGKGVGKQNPAWNGTDAGRKENCLKPEYAITTPATDAAKQWEGWGSAIKPSWEPIILGRKPLEGTIAGNVLKWKCGGLNIDGCRVAAIDGATTARKPSLVCNTSAPFGKGNEFGGNGSPLDRWPANLIHDGSEEVVRLFPISKGQQGAVGPQHGEKKSINAYSDYGLRKQFNPRSDHGSAARFFYCSKSSKADRGDGNNHPTVKPTSLMTYLCRLVTPTGGTVLDPFMGSGSTGKAAMLEGFNFVGIELNQEYLDIARGRIEHARAEAEKPVQKELFAEEDAS